MENWICKNILRWLLAILLFLMTPLSGYTQGLRKIREIKIDDPIALSVDRKGAIFIAHKNGRISKIFPDGEVELNFSPQLNASVSLLEAWTTLDILAFYEGLQSLTLLNRFLTPVLSIDLSRHIGYARLATYNYESNVWVIDDSDFTVKLFDTSLKDITIETPLNLILDRENYDITFMREYQNLLFMSDLNAGILIFDNLGNYLRTLSTDSVRFFGFVNNEIYYKTEDRLVFQDIYSGKENTVDIPTADYYAVYGNRIYLFYKGIMSIYTY